MAGSNILLFDQNKENMMTDVEYAAEEQRTDGVQTGIASSKLQNKFQYQVSLVAYAIAQMMVANGKDANDADTVATFVSNLSDSVLQKVIDKASQATAQTGADDTKYMTPLKSKQLIDYLKSTLAQAEAGTDDNTWMTPAKVKAAILEFAPGTGGGATASWDGETLVLTNSVPPNNT